MLSSTVPVYDNSLPQVTMISGLRVRQDLIFSNHKGQDKGRVRKRTEKSLQKLAEPLRKVMGPDEVIVYVVRCLAGASVLEQWFLGWTAQYALAVTLVFTNQRLLHISSDRTGAWRRSSIRSLPWSDMAAARMRGWPSTVLEVTHSGKKKQRYWALPFFERKKLRQLLSLLGPGEGAVSAKGWTSLCSECAKPLAPATAHCTNCGAVFKSLKTMRWRTVLIPGGGYFYCGQTLLGILHSIGDSILLLLLAFLGVTLALNLMGQPGWDSAELDVTSTTTILGFYIGIFALEKTIAAHHCRRFINEFIPTNRRQMGATANTMKAGSS